LDPSDAQLAEATRAGDAHALEELYRRYAIALMATAYRLLLSRADAEDVHAVGFLLRPSPTGCRFNGTTAATARHRPVASPRARWLTVRLDDRGGRIYRIIYVGA
jgi:hypothetical protein